MSHLENSQKVNHSLSGSPERVIFVIRHVPYWDFWMIWPWNFHKKYNFLFWTWTSSLQYYVACRVTSLHFVSVTQEAESTEQPPRLKSGLWGFAPDSVDTASIPCFPSWMLLHETNDKLELFQSRRVWAAQRDVEQGGVSSNGYSRAHREWAWWGRRRSGWW